MHIIKKSEAMKILAAAPKAYKFKYDSGKYKWSGSEADHVGLEVTDFDGVLCVYVERRSDNDGPYTQLMSIHTDEVLS